MRRMMAVWKTVPFALNRRTKPNSLSSVPSNLCTLLSVLLLLAVCVPSFLASDYDQISFDEVDQFPARRCDECDQNAIHMNRSLSGETSDHQSGGNSSDVKHPIDWNKVEENFHKVLSEDEVFHKWDTMETNMKSGIRNLLKTIFPKVVSLSADAKVSGNCSAGILKWIVSLRHMKAWSLKMLDAIGKPPSGIFEGVVSMFGNYDQCLKLRVFHEDDDGTDGLTADHEEPKEFFRGQYCVAEFKPWLTKKPHFYGMNTVLKSSFHEPDSVFSEFTKMAVFFHFLSFRVDLCVPSTCTKDDIQRVANLMANLADFRARVLRCETDDGETLWTWNFLAISVVVAILVTVSCLGTLLEMSLISCSWAHAKYLALFSVRKSWKQLTVFGSQSSSQLSALHSARAVVLLWIIAVHTFIVVDFQYFREMQTLKSWATKWPSQIFTNSLFQFDCFILITAFLFAHINIENNGLSLMKYILRRYLKISILILSMMLVTLSLPFVLQRGPLTQDFVAKQTQSCQADGWRNLLFFQNFFHTDCLPSTWIFCVELQLMLFTSPLLLLFYYSSERTLTRKLFWFAFPLLVIGGFLYNFLQVYIYKLPPMYYWTLPDKEQRNEYFDNYFYKPWTHLSVFAIGFYAGVYRKLSNCQLKTIQIDQSVNICLGHFLSILTIVTFTFGFHDWITGELPNDSVSAMYNSCQNVFLALAYSWILYSISDSSKSHSESSPLRRLLRVKFFRILGKLTLTGYLTLPLVQTLLLSSQHQHLYSSTLLMVYVILGNVIFTYVFALTLSLLVEIPTTQIVASFLNYLFAASQVSETSSVTTTEKDKLETPHPPSSNSSFQAAIELPICKEKL